MNNNDEKGTRKNNYDMSIMMEIKGQELDNLLKIKIENILIY